MSPLPVVQNQFTPSKAWDVSVGSGIGEYYSNLHPAALDGVVYAADRNGRVKALSESDGKEVWSVNLAEKTGWLSSNLPALLSGGLTVSGGHVYVGSEKAKVFALNTSDGSIAWQTTVAGEALSRPVVSDGLVLIHTSNGQLQGLDRVLAPLSGPSTWIFVLTLRGESAPATAYGAAIVGGDNGRVSAVLMQKGQIVGSSAFRATGSTEIDRLSDVILYTCGC